MRSNKISPRIPLENVVAYALSHLAPPIPPSFNVVDLNSPEDYTPAFPHPVFTWSIESPPPVNGLADLMQTAWRVLVLQGDKGWGVVECDTDGSEASASVNRGPHVQGTIDALNFLEQQGQLNSDDQEVRLVEVPAIYLCALWLPKDSGNSLTVLAPCPAEFETARMYSEPEFTDKVSKVAERRFQTARLDPRAAQPTFTGQVRMGRPVDGRQKIVGRKKPVAKE